MSLFFYSTQQMKTNWPKDKTGVPLALPAVNQQILGSKLNDQLANHFNECDTTPDGTDRWFFTDIPVNLGKEILSKFAETSHKFIMIQVGGK